MCQPQCSPDKSDKVLRDEVVDLERFCFFECKPADGPNAVTKSQCVDMSEHEKDQTIDPAGNPIDPAFIYAPREVLYSQPPGLYFSNGGPWVGPPPANPPAASANLLSKSSRVTHGAVQVPAADEKDPKEAEKEANKGKKQANVEGEQARMEAAKLREMENIKQQELNQALQSSGNGQVMMDPFAGIKDLDNAAVGATVSAQDASVAASQAIQAYDIGRKKIWGLALAAAGKEVLSWKKYAEEKLKNETEARFKPTWQQKALKEAQQASKPYIEGMLHAQESVKMYNEKGFQTASEASQLWNEAQRDGAQADKLPRSTMQEENVAQSDIIDARNKGRRSQEMTVEARQYFTTAANVRKTIPYYQYQAQKAAAEAVANFERTP
jgi:hypothetical protein